MTKGAKTAVTLLLAVAVMIVLGVLAREMNGVSIRSASQTYKMGKLEVASQVILPGVPVIVEITLESLGAIKTLPILLLRLSTETIVVDEITYSELSEGRARVVLPCSSGAGKSQQARLVLVDGGTRNMLAQSGSLTVLEQGPDCMQ